MNDVSRTLRFARGCGTILLTAQLLFFGVSCGHDVDLPAPRDALAFVDAMVSVAPAESVTLTATGGVTPYTFSILEPTSGAPTIEASTGIYVAGVEGPAIDLVGVTDAAGVTATARVNVGPPLAVSPVEARIEPGGSVSFVATGGKAPYTFTLSPGSGATLVGQELSAPSGGGCGNPVIAAGSATLTASDATTAPSVTLRVTWTRGVDLFPASGAAEVAPTETIGLVATGGRPPYTFDLVDDPSSGTQVAEVDPARGLYTAGSIGSANGNTVTDTVRVSDANGESQCLDFLVGPALSLTVSATSVRSGTEVQLLAEGGLAPYSFSFAPLGNRSRASLDPYGGIYVAGSNAGATDLVMVEDAMGEQAGPISIHVVTRMVTAGDQPAACAIADVTGDSFGDLVILNRLSGQTQLWIASFPPGEAPTLTTSLYWYPNALSVTDLNADTLAEVSMLHFYLGSPATGWQLRTYTVGPDQTPQAAWASPVYAQTPSDGHRLYWIAQGVTPVNGVITSRTFLENWTGPCSPGLAVFDVPAGAAVPTGNPTCAVTATGSVLDATVADLNGDTFLDLVWAQGGGVFYASLANAAGVFAAPISVTIGSGWALLPYQAPWFSSSLLRRARLVDRDGVAVALRVGTTSQYGLAMLRYASPNLVASPVTTVANGVYSAFTALNPGPSAPAVALIGTATGVDVYRWDGTSFVADPASAIAASGFYVGCLATGDVNGDGVADLGLVSGDTVAHSEVWLGAGDGTFGTQVHYYHGMPPAQRFWRAVEDVNGDGRRDLVAVNGDGTVETMFGGNQTLAVSEPSIAGISPQALAVTDADHDGAPDLVSVEANWRAKVWRGSAERLGWFADPEAVEITQADGTTFNDIFYAIGPQRASLLTPHAGRDLLAGDYSGNPDWRIWARGLYFLDGQHAVAIESEHSSSPTYGDQARPLLLAVDLDGDGISDAVMGGKDGKLARVRVALTGTPPLPVFQPLEDITQAGAWSEFFFGVGAISAGDGLAAENAVFVAGSSASGGSTRVVVIGDSTVTAILADDVAGAPLTAAVGDIDGDAIADLAIQRQVDGRISVYLGTSAGQFDLADPRWQVAAPFSQAPSSGDIAVSGNQLFILGALGERGDIVVHTRTEYVLIPTIDWQ